jgi:hypothetical protein
MGESHSKNAAIALDFLQIRLIEAKSIQHEILQLKSSQSYLTFEQVRKRESVVEASIKMSNKIKKEIEELKADKFLLPDETELYYHDVLDKILILERKKI